MIYLMGDASYVCYIDISIVYAAYYVLRVSADFVEMCLYDEASLAWESGENSAELHNHELTCDLTLHQILK